MDRLDRYIDRPFINFNFKYSETGIEFLCTKIHKNGDGKQFIVYQQTNNIICTSYQRIQRPRKYSKH